jgi:hypothetical protein
MATKGRSTLPGLYRRVLVNEMEAEGVRVTYAYVSRNLSSKLRHAIPTSTDLPVG